MERGNALLHGNVCPHRDLLRHAADHLPERTILDPCGEIPPGRVDRSLGDMIALERSEVSLEICAAANLATRRQRPEDVADQDEDASSPFGVELRNGVGSSFSNPSMLPLLSRTSTMSIAVSTLNEVFQRALSGSETWKALISSVAMSQTLRSCFRIKLAKRFEHLLELVETLAPRAAGDVVGARGERVQEADDTDLGVEQRRAADLAGKDASGKLPCPDLAAVCDIGNRHAAVSEEIHRAAKLGRAAPQADRNQAVVAALAEGRRAAETLDAVLYADPSIDAVMIAFEPGRGPSARNSGLLAACPVLGSATLASRNCAVPVLYNAIHPAAERAPLVAAVTLEVLAPSHFVTGDAVVRAGTPVVLADAHRVKLGPDGVAILIETLDAGILSGLHACAAVHLGALAVQNGTVIGRTVAQPNVLVEDGRVLRLGGQTEFRIPCALFE